MGMQSFYRVIVLPKTIYFKYIMSLDHIHPAYSVLPLLFLILFSGFMIYIYTSKCDYMELKSFFTTEETGDRVKREPRMKEKCLLFT